MGGTVDGVGTSMHMLGVGGHRKLFKLNALRSFLRPYLHPNITIPTRIPGGNIPIRYTSVVTKYFSHMEPDKVGGLLTIDNLDKNSFYFVLCL